MSSFHPLGTGDQDPLSLRQPSRGRVDDDDSWTPPVLPGDSVPGRHTTPSTSGSNRRTTPLETPLDPLLNTLPGASSRSTEAPEHDSPSFGHRSTWGTRGNENGYTGPVARELNGQQGRPRDVAAQVAAVRPASFGSSSTVSAAAGPTRQITDGSRRSLAMVHTLRPHTYYAPTFCDACSQLLIGIMQQGLRCVVCHMNLHPECADTPCSIDHRCRPPEAVSISAGVDEAQLEKLGLKPGSSSASASALGGGGIAEVLARRARGATAGKGGASLEDPLQSEWHKTLMRDKQLWVPDSVALGCMVCARTFNLVIRRHHCRRCGACMCSWCSHMTVSDKILSVNQNTGMVVRISSPNPVRCCTPCTRILDQQLKNALQRRAWGPKLQQQPSVTAAAPPVSRENYQDTAPPLSHRAPQYRGDGISGVGVDPLAEGPGTLSRADNVSGGEGQGPGSSLENGADDPIFRNRPMESTVGKYRAPKSAPVYVPHKREEESAGVPSWLGQRSITSKRPTGTPATDRAPSDRGSSDRSSRDRGGGGVDTADVLGGSKAETEQLFLGQPLTAGGLEEVGEDEGVFDVGLGGGVFDPNPLPPKGSPRSETAEDEALDWLNSGAVV